MQRNPLVERLARWTLTAVVLVALAGCEENTTLEQRVQALKLGAPPATEGQVTLRFPDRHATQLNFSSAGTVVCPQTTLHSCTSRGLGVDATGRLQLDEWLIETSQEKYPFDGGRKVTGVLYGTPFELQGRFSGFRPAWSDCRRTSYRRDKLGADRFLETETIACDPLVLRPSDAGAAQLQVEDVTRTLPATRQSLVASSIGDYPLEVVLRTRLRGISGWTRVDSECPLPGWNGSPALGLVSRQNDGQANRYEFALDQLLMPAAQAPRVDVFVRPVGQGQFGFASLSLQVDTPDRGVVRRTTLRLPPEQRQELVQGRYYHAIAWPRDSAASVRAVDEIVDGPDLGTCIADAIRVLAVRTSPRSTPARPGDAIDIDVQFSAPVTATALHLVLETGANDRSATLVGGSGTDTLRLRYTVAAGDTSPALNYHSVEALFAQPTDVLGAAGRSVNLALPPLDSAGALRAAGVQVQGS